MIINIFSLLDFGNYVIKQGNVETLYDKSGKVISVTTYNGNGGKTVERNGIITIYYSNGQYKFIEGNVETLYNSSDEVVSTTTNLADGSYAVKVGTETMFYDKDGNYLYKRIENGNGGYTIIKNGVETVYDKDGKVIADEEDFSRRTCI